ncbi:MAG: class I SAM-dependent methyltransferase, partial [Bdellovibrionales bacterium]|nr:class I SAM-dependent methyltransferase [Bdellovibrionales bacterium]
LDLGVGAGRFADLVVAKGGKVIGVDLSDAVEVARKNLTDDSRSLIIQADGLNLPIRPDSCDGTYSIGVLHHTPDPFCGLREMFLSLKAGGWIACCVYQKNGYYDSLRVKIWRNIFSSLSRIAPADLPVLLYSYLCAYVLYYLTYIPILGHLIRASFPMVRLPDIRWRLLDTYDSVTPAYQSAHTSAEVEEWFKRLRCDNVEKADWGTSSYRGVKDAHVVLEATDKKSINAA